MNKDFVFYTILYFLFAFIHILIGIGIENVNNTRSYELKAEEYCMEQCDEKDYITFTTNNFDIPKCLCFEDKDVK